MQQITPSRLDMENLTMFYALMFGGLGMIFPDWQGHWRPRWNPTLTPYDDYIVSQEDRPPDTCYEIGEYRQGKRITARFTHQRHGDGPWNLVEITYRKWTNHSTMATFTKTAKGWKSREWQFLQIDSR